MRIEEDLAKLPLMLDGPAPRLLGFTNHLVDDLEVGAHESTRAAAVVAAVAEADEMEHVRRLGGPRNADGGGVVNWRDPLPVASREMMMGSRKLL